MTYGFRISSPVHLRRLRQAGADVAPDGAAETWFGENDPEGVAFEYEVLE